MNLSDPDAARLSLALRQLLSPDGCGDVDVWRGLAGRAVRDLVGADAACVALDGDASSFVAVDLDDSVVRAYGERYAAVDHGIARMRRERIEVWERRMLWRKSELARSEYYNDFALPHRLLDAAGITSFAAGQCVRVCLMYAEPPRSTRGLAAWRGQLQLLRLAWPAFNAGSILSARAHSRQASMAQIIDRVGHPLGLCTTSGRLVHGNAALLALVAQNGAALAETIQSAARAVAASAASRRAGESVTRELMLTDGGHRLVGWPVEMDLVGAAAVLISIVSAHAQAPTSEALRTNYQELRAQFGLTRRQLEVVELLRQRRSNAEIAHSLRISEHTARHHTEMVLSKLGLHSRRQIETQYDSLADPQPELTS